MLVIFGVMILIGGFAGVFSLRESNASAQRLHEIARQTILVNDAYKDTLIIALASEDEPNPEGLSEYGYSEAFKKPFDVQLLAERIRTLVEEKRENL